MAYLPADRYDYDVFVSFSHKDNGLLPGQDPREGGWVERFARVLEVWLRDQRGLNGLKVWLDKGRLSGVTQIDNRIQGDLGRTGLLMVLHSRNYRHSDYCQQELGWFLDAAARQPAGLAVNNERRVFNVLINNIAHPQWTEGGHWTRPLGGTLGFRFHDAAGDDTQAFGDPIDPSDQPAYRAAMRPIVDAAYRLLTGFPPDAKAETPAP
ncbi:MAG TPA: toll/interleukin-1 receptor domain-containing protein, partial [Lamprocystis sp. (in: g-proteobacteria)]|nr:toll/interleukin-1 receptor domain-containing protein [Lamprocystis sp. (in: g-proteobacteria)]